MRGGQTVSDVLAELDLVTSASQHSVALCVNVPENGKKYTVNFLNLGSHVDYGAPFTSCLGHSHQPILARPNEFIHSGE